MAVNATLVNELRQKTNAGVMECKKALEEAKGDLAKAEDILRIRGQEKAGKKADRETKEGLIISYIHGTGKIGVMLELNGCRKAFPNHYIRLMAFDSTRNVETIVMSFIVNRPKDEPGFMLERQEADGRSLRYTTRGYAAARPEGQRYGA